MSHESTIAASCIQSLGMASMQRTSDSKATTVDFCVSIARTDHPKRLGERASTVTNIYGPSLLVWL